jgi:methylmalonyl-CoA mutase cobalamin-binding subunit
MRAWIWAAFAAAALGALAAAISAANGAGLQTAAMIFAACPLTGASFVALLIGAERADQSQRALRAHNRRRP